MISSLAREDLDRIAWLHVESIRDSLPALLGERYATRFYEFLTNSDQEHLFVERVHGRVESACVVSLSPATLQTRIALKTMPSLAGSALRALRGPEFRGYMRAVGQDALRRKHEAPPAPEITYIFTNPQKRCAGLGARMIRRVDAFLRGQSLDRYFVKTIAASKNRAVDFYRANGFVTVGSRIEAGRRYVEFQKNLVPLPSDKSRQTAA